MSEPAIPAVFGYLLVLAAFTGVGFCVGFWVITGCFSLLMAGWISGLRNQPVAIATNTPVIKTSVPVLAPAPAPAKKTVIDPRVKVGMEALDLASKIENIATDYSNQIHYEEVKQENFAKQDQERAQSEEPFSRARRDKIRSFERDRYNSLYLARALAVRDKMLESIPDIPLYDLNTTEAKFLYEHPTNPSGFKEVAKNLRDLEAAYMGKIAYKK